MKKLLTVIALLALPFTAQADVSTQDTAGYGFDSRLFDDYDRGYGGIWQLPELGLYGIVAQDGDKIALIVLHEDLGWEALIGSVTDTQAKLGSVISTTPSKINIEFESDDRAYVIQQWCMPISSEFSCTLTNNVSYEIVKVF